MQEVSRDRRGEVGNQNSNESVTVISVYSVSREKQHMQCIYQGSLVGDWSTSQFCKKLAETCSYQLCIFFNSLCHPDVVDIKPTNMEELTEVITASIFHPVNCNEFVYSSSKGTIRLCDMREKALCDAHAKSKVGERAMTCERSSHQI